MRDVLKALTTVLNWIENGYKLPLITEPLAHMQANQPAAIEHGKFVIEAVADLLRNGCAQKVVAAPHVCSPLSDAEIVVYGEGYAKAFYVFTILPFSLATACYVFTKLLQPLVKFWRSQGLRAVLYLDDGIVASKGLEAAR